MLRLALRTALTAELLLVPTKQNPLKESPGAMIDLIQAWLEDLADSLSYQDFRRIRLETFELTSTAKKSYTVDTLGELSSPGENWALLLGSDSASQFAQWKDPQKVLSLVKELWIVPRGQHTNTEIEKIIHSVDKKAPIKFLNPVTAISSTVIRNGTLSQPLDEFLSPRVLAVWKQVHSC